VKFPATLSDVIRDPAGNAVEVNGPDAAGLDSSIRREMTRLVETFPQSAENLKGILYLEPRRGHGAG